MPPEPHYLTNSEISLTRLVAAITIEFDRVAGAFTGRAAILAVFRLRTRTRWVLAFLFFSHDFLPGVLRKSGFINEAQSLTQSGEPWVQEASGVRSPTVREGHARIRNQPDRRRTIFDRHPLAQPDERRLLTRRLLTLAERLLRSCGTEHSPDNIPGALIQFAKGE